MLSLPVLIRDLLETTHYGRCSGLRHGIGPREAFMQAEQKSGAVFADNQDPEKERPREIAVLTYAQRLDKFALPALLPISFCIAGALPPDQRALLCSDAHTNGTPAKGERGPKFRFAL